MPVGGRFFVLQQSIPFFIKCLTVFARDNGRMDGPNLPLVHTEEDSDDKFFEELSIIMFAIEATEEDNNTRMRYKTCKSTHLMNRAMDLLDELRAKIPDDIYIATTVALTNEQLQVVFVRMSKEHRKLWLSKLKPLE